jgi:periplasmic protein TonB
MTCPNHNRFLVPAWGVSLTLHSVAVVLAMLFAAQVRPVLQEEPFKWDVALVDSVKTDSAPDLTPTPQPVVPPVQAPTRVTAPRPVEPPPDTVMHRVAPQQTVQMVHPEVQPPKPVEQAIEPIEQQLIEVPKTKPEPVAAAKEPEPVESAEPVIAQRQPIAPPPSEAVESRPIETPAKPSASEAVATPSPVEPAPTVSSPPNPGPPEAPVQAAKAAPSGPEVKTDHRWLAESLWRRVAELKRYPSSARLNGQEGKVILKAVIRSDGHLMEVTVQKSSGHQILDAAAIEAVKLACPLHMKHAINKPEIVVSLPIVYSLAN